MVGVYVKDSHTVAIANYNNSNWHAVSELCFRLDPPEDLENCVRIGGVIHLPPEISPTDVGIIGCGVFNRTEHYICSRRSPLRITKILKTEEVGEN